VTLPDGLETGIALSPDSVQFVMPSLSLSMSILFIPSLSVSIGQSLTGISSDGVSVPQLIMNFYLIISRSSF
jgi:hypothetical protein